MQLPLDIRQGDTKVAISDQFFCQHQTDLSPRETLKPLLQGCYQVPMVDCGVSVLECAQQLYLHKLDIAPFRQRVHKHVVHLEHGHVYERSRELRVLYEIRQVA